MDIKSFVSIQNQPAFGKLAESRLNLMIGQKLDAKVISANVSAEKSAIILKVADHHLSLQSLQPVELTPGQALKIQVIQLVPAVEFKILSPLPELKPQTAVLSLNSAQPLTEQQEAVKNFEAALVLKQQFGAKIIGLAGHRIQLQVVSQTNTGSQQEVVLIIERSQLQLPKTTAAFESTPEASALKSTPTLKIGQVLNLEVIKTGINPEFKLLPAFAIPEEKITDWVRQLLPRHEASPVFLNQLIQDLPRLLNNENVSQSLKRIAAGILQTLPGQQQLIDQQGIKHSVSTSGLFLEAGLQQSTEKPALTFKNDFKANLLKFVQALKQEATMQSRNELNNTELGMLKNLERKSENVIAKIVLDQLISLPKEDAPRQVWILDIPFMEKEKADAVKIEIQREKKNNEQNNDRDWSVNVTITPPGLGTIYCTVSYLDDGVHACFLSQKPQTTDLINDHLDYFRQQLEQSGLTTGRIIAQNGAAKTKPDSEIAGKQLVDDRA